MYSNRASIPQEYLFTENDEIVQENTGNWETLQMEKTGENPLICSSCNKRKVYIYTKLKSRKDNRTITFKRMLLIKNEFRKGNAA